MTLQLAVDAAWASLRTATIYGFAWATLIAKPLVNTAGGNERGHGVTANKNTSCSANALETFQSVCLLHSVDYGSFTKSCLLLGNPTRQLRRNQSFRGML